MKNLLLFSFVAILLMGCDENSENLPAPNYTIEGKWLNRRDYSSWKHDVSL